MTMTHASLFSGIGGFDLAAEWAGWTNMFNCEIDLFCRRVLAYHFPNAVQYEDIRTTDFTVWRGRIDVLTGGFPCQPFSVAGKRKGTDDDRYLWPEMLRAIREIRPRWVVGENVRGFVNWSEGMVLDTVFADLEALGYEVQPFILPACAVGAPHRRDRVWIAAHARRDGGSAETERQLGANAEDHEQPESLLGDGSFAHRADAGAEGLRERQEQADEHGSAADSDNYRFRVGPCQQKYVAGECRKADTGVACQADVADAGRARFPALGLPDRFDAEEREVADRCAVQPARDARRTLPAEAWENFPTQPPVCGGDDGLPAGLDGITFPSWRMQSIKAYGNAIVPQVFYQIAETINEYERL